MTNSLETSLLGLILTDSSRFYDVADVLAVEHFTDRVTTSVYGSMQSLIMDGKGLTPALIEARCKAEHPEITMSAYLASLAFNAPEQVDVRDLADELIALSRVRKFRGVVAELQKMAEHEAKQSVPNPNLIEEAVTKITGAFRQETYGGIRHISVGARDILAEARSSEPEIGVFTGFDPVDTLFAPFMPGDMTVVAGGTSMGKSSLMQVVTRHCALNNIPVLLLSAEMTAKDTEQRIMSQAGNVNTMQITQPKNMNADEIDRLMDTQTALANAPLYIDGTRRPTIEMIRLRCQRAINQFGVRIVLFDHLHYCKLPRATSRYEAMTEITAAFKELAGDLGIHLFLGSQLSREYSKQDAHRSKDIRRPREGDLRDSGSIEQDADNIVFIHRPERILERNKPSLESADRFADWQSSMEKWKGTAELIRTKQRQGPGHKILPVRFIPETTNITAMTTDQESMI